MQQFWKEPLAKDLIRILKYSHNLAVVGLSDNPFRPSFGVAGYLIKAGYNIIPVNPNYSEVLGRKCYPSLKEVPEKIDLVDVFRRPNFLMAIVEDTISLEIPILWLQLGVFDREAVVKAKEAGLEVVINRCIKIDHSRYRAEI